MMREAFLKDRYRAVEQAVRAEKTILVLGADASLLSQALRDHPLLDIWDSQNHGGATISKSLPQNTGCILVSRFVNHGTLASVSKQAKAIGVPLVQQILQTGELKQVLAPLLVNTPEPVKTTHRLGWTSIKNIAPPAQEARAMSNTPKSFHRGELRAFIAQHGQAHASPVSESARIYALALDRGYATTPKSVENSFRNWRKERGVLGPRQRGPAPTVAPPMVAQGLPPTRPALPLVPAPSLQAPVVAATMPRTGTGLGRNIRDAVRLLDESIAAMTLVRDELAKHQDAIERSANESQILGEMQAIMAKLGR